MLSPHISVLFLQCYQYTVQFDGVGESEDSRRREVGFCTQIAVFQRLESIPAEEHTTEEPFPLRYDLEGTTDMPCSKVSGSLLQRIVDETVYIEAFLWRNYGDELYTEVSE
jgi:hypothetical protein